MSPLDIVEWLGREWSAAGIRAVTCSGQACVYYGIQQTTKDSDWIIEPEDLSLVRVGLARWEQTKDFTVGYRSQCGAPLDFAYLSNGWSTHITLAESGRDHRIDIFGRGPRVTELERDRYNPQMASRHVVAQMKKTDREKDWPIVFGLGCQMLELGDPRGLLHVQDASLLLREWAAVRPAHREELVWQRPLLAMIETSPRSLPRAIALERAVWANVNRLRYRRYQHAWKEFYQSWRRDPTMDWPVKCPFLEQHEILLAAATRFSLSHAPLPSFDRSAILSEALARVVEIMAATDVELEQVVPPLELLLP